MKPFLKWAGGKSQLLDVINSELPLDIKEKKIYIEPFVGAGALFFYFLENNMFEKYIINDINSKLINLYTVIRDNPNLFIKGLKELKDLYLSLDIESDKRSEMFYEIRDKFNSNDIGDIDLAVYFVFLNKTCFNGLYRENSKGEFNVPFGKYKNPSFFDEENILDISRALNKRNDKGEFVVTITNDYFSSVKKYLDKDTFMYLDPPYRPITLGGFNSYNKSGFNDEKQIELRDFYEEMSAKGAKLMLSNSDPKNLDINDNFFDELYSKFNIIRVKAGRSINSNGKSRGKISELLIKNY